tara:strand:- start:328 stop:690 length:363 start_codon:yes stop_codon:yes gene_type:complete
LNQFKETLKGIIVIILAPLVFAITQTIANIIGSIINGDLSGDRTGLIVFVSSSIIGFILVNIISYLISSKKSFYIIGQVFNILILFGSMILENYNWLYYSAILVGLYFIVNPEPILKKLG